ncbi:putative pore-forming protein precursor [Monocercomonoides exilis]|uniref:putative pore-forming protein precursor n=1 Tax=Monocercomonoides exilis TaxID=2049356 RepID=UPI003559679E|nr:putative pore-forming protein precursor [Monocercomonoides exilis]|eukprot:MONOS_3061.1-p1 / transcript=MONOS_3061.1 / gene=MONOS_3061 / organism=Monocercomonoides_exilis_PA203 / gene_product=pore-forming protein isoform B precursor / transcript_product=pore-forming protein isoform B precursor / location=Mono_scaffold00068:86528-86887(+) / protein_length=120 / sequence_SO=supercontig / SO=protein_coding / is_pseudo=false
MFGLFLVSIFAMSSAEEFFGELDDYFETEEAVDYDSFEAYEAAQWCEICQEVAAFAEQMLKNHGGEALKKLILDKLCSKMKGIKGEICEAATNKVIDFGFELVEKYLNPEYICRKVKLC